MEFAIGLGLYSNDLKGLELESKINGIRIEDAEILAKSP